MFGKVLNMEETSVDLASSNESGGYVFAPFKPDESDDDDEGAEISEKPKSSYRPQASSNSSSGSIPLVSSPSMQVQESLFVSPLENDPRANNWNERYQKLIEQPESIEKYESLRDLARDFEYAAQLYARLIVSEVCLPVESKSIKPSNVIRGSAGGMKFICCGSILFKFALDVQLEDGTFMYGGKTRNDSLAMKSGNHELKGLIAYMGSEIKGLCFSLSCCIDYKGYRLLATTVLPINNNTIKYGSSNGGRTIHMSDRHLSSLMKEAACKIGLAPLPLVGGNELYGPSDLEGHLGTDGRYYVVDFARAMPPEYIARKSRLYHPRSIFFFLLRPELVQSFGTALCPDAFSGFLSSCESESASKSLNLNVYLACKKLRSVTIPNFARDLSVKFAGHAKSISSKESLERAMEHLRWLCCETHRRGINFRHFGEIRAHLSDKFPYVSLLLLTEMSTRVLKSELRTLHRKVMEKITLPSDAPFRIASLVLLNNVVESSANVSAYWSLAKGEDGPCMKELLQRKYSEGLRKDEEIDGFDLRRNVSLRLLLLRLQEISCIKFSERARIDLLESPLPFAFADGDIERVEAYAKTLHLVSFAEANISYLKAINCGEKQTSQALRLLESAIRHLEVALDKATTNLRIMFLLASALYRVATLLHMQELDHTLASETQQNDEESESGTDDLTDGSASERESRTTSLFSRQPSSSTNWSNAIAAATSVLRNEDSLVKVASVRHLVKANQTLDRLMQLCSAEQAQTSLGGLVHALWGDIKCELANQLRHYVPHKKRHTKMTMGAVLEFKQAFQSVASSEIRDLLAKDSLSELSSTSRSKNTIAEHKLLKLHVKCQSYLLVKENDVEMLLIAAELEVNLAKRTSKQRKAKRLMDLALTRFLHVYKMDPVILEEYYARKRSVLFSVAQQSDAREPAVALVLSYIVAMLARDGIRIEPADKMVSVDNGMYPSSVSEYNLIRPIRGTGQYSDSSGALWQALCLTTKQTLAIKVVDSTNWKRLGTLAQKIVKLRRKIRSEKIVHFLQVFDDNNSTYFVMPLYLCSAFDLYSNDKEIPMKVLIAILKLTILAVIELHQEGVVHGKLTMRNILIEEVNDVYSIRLTNKCGHIINTVYHRLITGAHDSFSPLKSGWLNRLDYDSFADNEPANDETEMDEDQSSSDTTGTLSLEIRSTLTENVKQEQRKSESLKKFGVQKFGLIAKSEDVAAVVKLLSKTHEIAASRLSSSRSSLGGSNGMSALIGNNSNSPNDDWSDLLPFFQSADSANSRNGEKQTVLPKLESLLEKKIFRNCSDPISDLSTYMRQRLLKRSSNSSNDSFVRDSYVRYTYAHQLCCSFLLHEQESCVLVECIFLSRGPVGSASQLEEVADPPEELFFAPGSKRDRLLHKLDDIVKRQAKSGRLKKSFSAKSTVSPRAPTFKNSVMSVLSNAVSAEKRKGLASLFGGASPTNTGADEFDLDVVCVATVFFFNRTVQMWNDVKCQCATMEAGKGKWLWRSVATGVVAALSPNLYFKYLMAAFYDMIHKSNLLQSKLAFDLTSAARLFVDLREHLRRLARLYYHVAYSHFSEDLTTSPSGSESDNDHMSTTPRSPQSSPPPHKQRHSDDRSMAKQRRRSSDRKLSKSSNSVAEIPSDLLWEIFREFCLLFRVDLSEEELLRKPLFQ